MMWMIRWFAVLALLAHAPFAAAQAPTYSSIYNPLRLENYYLTMDSNDWNTIKGDNSFSIVKPAYFNITGESKMLIGVNRKPTLVVGTKVGLKFDINEYFDQNVWHGVKKLSMENGEGGSVLHEAMAWRVHDLAADYVNTKGYNYHPGKFTFANIYVNGVNQGLYTHVEQVDKTFLRNRDQWIAGETWLYKQQEVNLTELQEGSSALSPARSVLSYQPFESAGPPTPSDAVLATQLPQYINMDGLLTLAACNQFISNRDALLYKGKNYFWADYEDAIGIKRQHYPWDLDGSFSGGGTTHSIYAGGPYVDMILDIPAFRMRYNEIMLDLLNNPLSVSNLHAYLDQLEPIVPSAGSYSGLKSWITARHANILSQVQADMALLDNVPEPGAAVMIGIAVGVSACRRRRVCA